MPYTYRDVETIKSRYGYTTHEAHIFIRAFNAALDKYDDEETAFKVAHAAVNKYQRHRGKNKRKAFTAATWENVGEQAEAALQRNEAAFLNNIFGWIIEEPKVLEFEQEEEDSEESIPISSEILGETDEEMLYADVMDDVADELTQENGAGGEVPLSYLGRFTSPDTPVGVDMHEIVAFGDSHVIALTPDVPGLPTVYAIAGTKAVANALINAYRRRGFAAFPVYIEE